MTSNNYEIERKFLLDDPSIITHRVGVEIKQGYLCVDPDRTVRVRIAGNDAWLTIKNRPTGLRRLEFEYQIPITDANHMLDALCVGTIIHKTRYSIEENDKVWEVDVFHSPCPQLQVVEVELDYDDEQVVIPTWVGKEVTGDAQYSNSMISKHHACETG